MRASDADIQKAISAGRKLARALPPGTTWENGCAALAQAGFESLIKKKELTPERAGKFFADLLLHPHTSKAHAPNLPENTVWLSAVSSLHQTLFGKAHEKAAYGSLCPEGAIGARLLFLAQQGADLDEHKALWRATCRQSLEEAKIISSLPKAPKPSQQSKQGSNCLHRSAHIGPNPVLELLSQRAAPEDWIHLDCRNDIPFDKAMQGPNAGRAQFCAQRTPFFFPNPKGDNLLHRFLRSALSRSLGSGPGGAFASKSEEERWLLVFQTICAKASAEELFSKNNEGQSAMDLWPLRPSLAFLKPFFEERLLRVSIESKSGGSARLRV